MSNILSIVGINIRKIRRIRGLSQAELATAMALLGCDVTSGQVGSWERAQKTISAEQLYYVAAALGVSTDSLYDSDNMSADDERMLSEIASHPQDDRAILRYIATSWSGDDRAMIHFAGMYAALPAGVRVDVAIAGITEYLRCKESGTLSVELPIDVDMVERRWRALFNRR